MKVLKSIFLFLLAIATVSCSSDDDGGYPYTKNNLTGTYSLVYLQSTKVKTVIVDGFEVVTTTETKGDTFDATYAFSADNKVVKNGSYRIVEKITQNNQTQESARIIVLDNEEVNYSVQESVKKLTIDGVTYDVSQFSATGFRLKRTESFEDSDGASIEFTEELCFTK